MTLPGRETWVHLRLLATKSFHLLLEAMLGKVPHTPCLPLLKPCIMGDKNEAFQNVVWHASLAEEVIRHLRALCAASRTSAWPLSIPLT